MKPKVVIDLHFFPCINYFAILNQCEIALVETHENYVKQSYRNRCYIRGANQIERLTVPVCGSKGEKVIMEKVKIDNNQNWKNINWRTIVSGYGNSPYFEHYAALFQKTIFQENLYLFDLNLNLMTLCLKLLEVNVQIDTTNAYHQSYQKDIIDLRGAIYQGNDLLECAIPYTQVFGSNFVKNLSIIDLLFCEGPNAPYYLQKVGKEFLSKKDFFSDKNR